MRAGLLLALAWLVPLGCAAEPPAGVIDLDVVQRIRVASDTPPAPDDPRWRTVSLPDWWGVAARRHGLEGWFRGTIRLAAAPREVWAVYLPRIGQHTTVWVNRALVGSSGPLAEPLPRNWNRPQLFTVPVSMLQAGENEILVRLVTHLGAPGFLSALHVGPMRVLEPTYAQRAWVQVTLGQIVGSATFAFGVLLLVFAIRHERFRAQRSLALGLVLWSWTSADAFFRTIPVPSRWWEASTAAALVWCMACFVHGFHVMLSVARPRVERAVLGTAVAYTIALVAAPRIYAFTLVLVGGAFAVAMAVYLVALLLRSPRMGRDFRRALVVPAAVGVLFGAHDLLLVLTGHAFFGVLMSPYIPVVAIAATGWILLEQHVASLRETEMLNRDLEARVAHKHRELEDNYDRLRALEREHAVVGERERIMQDMHDGMGGQLVSTLAMVESGGGTVEQVSDALRGALDDLRLVIDSLDPGEQDLLTALGMVRARLEPRLVRHGLRFQWRVAEVPPLPWFGPEMALQVMRVVQEAITNVVKHAGAATIRVRTGEIRDAEGRPGVFIDVEDDGRGVAASPTPGRGLAGMRRRAARLGGSVSVEATGAGTRVRLWLPQRASDASPSRARSFTRRP